MYKLAVEAYCSISIHPADTGTVWRPEKGRKAPPRYNHRGNRTNTSFHWMELKLINEMDFHEFTSHYKHLSMIYACTIMRQSGGHQISTNDGNNNHWRTSRRDWHDRHQPLTLCHYRTPIKSYRGQPRVPTHSKSALTLEVTTSQTQSSIERDFRINVDICET